jgi:hypothetical protein
LDPLLLPAPVLRLIPWANSSRQAEAILPGRYLGGVSGGRGAQDSLFIRGEFDPGGGGLQQIDPVLALPRDGVAV